MIRRKKTTIFTDAKDNTTVGELKKMIEGMKKLFDIQRKTKTKMSDFFYWQIIICRYTESASVRSASVQQK